MTSYFSIIVHIVFWASVFGILHTYAIYPLLMRKLASRKKDRPKYENEDQWPRVDVIMAMYNEDSVIESTLESIVASDYPPGKLNIHIGSDGSTDKSHAIVEAIAAKASNVNLRIFGGRNGKIRIINELVKDLPEDDADSVLLLCDANVTWSPEAARELVSLFKDEKIGIVASNVIDSKDSKAGIAQQENAYVNQENLVKFAEGEQWGRMMGAFGACYAMRRKAYRPVPPHFNVDDFFETMACYEQGYDGVVNLKAICYEAVSEDINEEFRRKRRISKGNFQNLRSFAKYLQPWNCGLATFFAFWSHKGLRWFGPLLLIAIFITGFYLAGTSSFIYLLMWTGMVASLGMAFLGRNCQGGYFKLFGFAKYFYSMNYALLLGGIEFCKGVQNSVWEPTKRVGDEKVTVSTES